MAQPDDPEHAPRRRRPAKRGRPKARGKPRAGAKRGAGKRQGKPRAGAKRGAGKRQGKRPPKARAGRNDRRGGPRSAGDRQDRDQRGRPPKGGSGGKSRAGKPPGKKRPAGARRDQGSAARGRGAPRARGGRGDGQAEGEAAAVFREARRAAQRARREERPAREPEPPPEPEIWIDEGRVDDPSARGRRRPPRRRERAGPPGRRPPREVPRRPGPLSRLTKKEQHRLHDASIEFQDEHFSDARKLVGDLAAHHPDIPEIRELHGLTLYRLERWREAARELEAFRELTGSAEQNPVLADCSRALQRHDEVDELWEELAAQSPSAPVVAEGRIVTAASLADRGDLDAAIRLLEGAPARTGKARPHDLRVWYALADLYDRAGDQPRARDLFARVVQHDSSFADAARRLTDLG